jgi:hypothetical protein
MAMTFQHPDSSSQFDIDRSKELTRENKDLIAKIDGESILKAPIVKGSIYFYVDTHGDGDLGGEELIDDPCALDTLSKELGIEIRSESRHHRWTAKIPQALMIIEFAATHLRQLNDQSSVGFGVNAELKWQDDRDIENIIHLTQGKDNDDWEVKRYC